MARPIAVLLSILLLQAGTVSADCGKSPADSTFCVYDDCDFTRPCLEDQPNTLRLSVDTSCYPSWKPCQTFTFGACDVVDWDFGDGTTARVTGSGTVTHTWANSGSYPVEVRVSNTTGQKDLSGRFIAARKPAAYVRWSGDLFTAGERDSNITLTLVREGDLSRAVPLLLCSGTRAGTADAWDRNLEHTWDRPVTIPAGASSIPVTLNIRNDDTYLGEQRYAVFVYDDKGEAILPTGNTTANTEVRIIDDETGPTLSVADVTVQEGDSGAQFVRIPHVLSQPLSEDLMLWWEIGNGTATRGIDWNTMNGGNYFIEQWIRAGQTRTDLEIRILGDRQAEDDETVVIKLANPLYAPVAFNQAQVTITIKDDDLYQLTPERSQVKVGTSVPLTIAIARPQSATTTAQVDTSDRSILAVPPTVTIPAGATVAGFDVQTLHPGVATVTAKFDDGNTVDARIVAELHTSLAAWTLRERFEPGQTSRVILATDPVVATTAQVVVDPAGIVEAPARIALDAKGGAAFEVEGLKPGAATLTVTLPPEYGSAAQSIHLTVVETLAPRIGDVVPSFGTTIGGTRVSVKGNDLSSDCVVTFGGVQATSAWVDASEIAATTPPHGAGAADVELRCGSMTSTRREGFRYVAPPRRRSVR